MYEDNWKVCHDCHKALVDNITLTTQNTFNLEQEMLKSAKKRKWDEKYLKSFRWVKSDFMSSLLFVIILVIAFVVLAAIILNMKFS